MSKKFKKLLIAIDKQVKTEKIDAKVTEKTMTDQNTLQPINGESMNLTDHNIEQLKQLFPNVFSEGKIDFDTLKSELGNAVEESNEPKLTD